MKKVAGTLKLDLAQFRELEAFSQFGSDLDDATKRQLERGRRSVELLKQPQYSPVLVEHQVVALYSLVKGYLDDVAVVDLQKFQAELIEYVETNAKTFMKQVREKRMWEDDGEAELKAAIASFKTSFVK
jgi:F-type H+-transporting ATPase subunit alpha